MKSRSFVPVKERLNCTRFCIANSLNIWQESFIEYLLNNDENTICKEYMKTNTNKPIHLSFFSR